MTRSGIHIEELSADIRPNDDLFQYVHAKWLARTEIPADKARWGSTAILAEAAERSVRTIIEEAQSAEPGTEQRKVGDLFASFMDEAAVNARGIDPIRAQLELVDGAATIGELLTILGGLERSGGPGIFGQYIDNDPGNPERYIVNVMQGGLGLPDESYYREDSFAEIRDAYRAYLTTMLTHAERADAAAEAALVFELETELAASHWDRVDSRDSVKTYNLLPFDTAYPVLAPWFAAVEVPAGVYAEAVVQQPSFFEALAGLLTDERLDAWKAWARAGIIRGYAPYLSTVISEDNFGFYGRVLTGAQSQRERWKRGVSLVEGALGDVVGKIYVERHFPPHAKSAMDDLIDHLVEAYRESISQLEWMGADTRTQALEKLDKFTPKIGYPARWKSYDSLAIGTDLIENVRASTAFEHDREFAKIGAPLDRDEWFMGPQVVNAYYNPGFNEIVFPAAILQPPFFDVEVDAATNFGAIGAVIGHEIGHGFDDQGSRYDGDGRLRDWWTADDRARFEERTSALIAQYDALTPKDAPEHHVNGSLTIGENIGDIGGLGIAWKAYVRSLNGAEAPVIDGLTAPQRFLLAWAQAWQLKIRPEEAVRLVSIDPHSPNEHRANQVAKNLDVFYEAWDVQPGDPMYLAPEERVVIW